MKNLLIILGPTGIGKTDLSIGIAQYLKTEIISADSRQIYREMSVGTATPSSQQLHTVKHHFIHSHSIQEYFNVSHYEQLVLPKLDELFKSYSNVMMTGGSMMYIDVVCNGIDELPDIDPELRKSLFDRFKEEGIETLKAELKEIDPDYYSKADLKNHMRIIHAIEITRLAGKPYSALLTQPRHNRSFNTIKIGLNTDREVLYNRINQRVDHMVESGLAEEVKKLYPYRHLPALNTVGYKELFNWLDGQVTFETAIEQIKANSRKYARKQLTWFRRDPEITWFDPSNYNAIINFVHEKTKQE